MGLNKRSKFIFRTKDNTPQYNDKRVSFLNFILLKVNGRDRTKFLYLYISLTLFKDKAIERW